MALSVLVIIFVDPSEPDRYAALTYAALVLYTLYSLALYLLAAYRPERLNSGFTKAHWIDVCCYLVFIALSSGTNSVFFFFFFFSILVASFQEGFASGIRVTIVSSLLFTVIGYLTAPAGRQFDLNVFLLRPVSLTMLGYLIAHRGQFEITLKRRLALLKEINLLSNPRFGIDRTVGVVLERVRGFYGAETCVLVMLDPDMGGYSLRRADREDPEAGTRAEPLVEAMKDQLLTLPDDIAVIYQSKARKTTEGRAKCYGLNLQRRTWSAEFNQPVERLAAVLDTASYLSVPVVFRGDILGRVNVAMGRPHPFEVWDIEFLFQIVEQVMPALENIRLVDRLASDAADEERRRIARDIHDSIIQPYIGLQLGLDSLYQRVATSNGGGHASLEQYQEMMEGLKDRVRRLLDMTHTGIDDLRGYVRGLTQAERAEASLFTSLRRYGEKVKSATGIDVEVKTDGQLLVTDRLAAEVFQMIAEGLSNIRRHTHSPWAKIELASADGSLVVRVENDGAGDMPRLPFMPQSIAQRAEALGGRARVERGGGRTIVIVEIPL